MSSSTPTIASSILGFPRMGSSRQLKFALELYWQSNSSPAGLTALLATAATLRLTHWRLQRECGLSTIPSNDFSLYDAVLDHSLLFGAVPERYSALVPVRAEQPNDDEGDQLNRALFTYFAMARGYQGQLAGVAVDVPALEMKKFFDTNYHYIVPELASDQRFTLNRAYLKPLLEYREARSAGIDTRPVLCSPVSYLLLSNVGGRSAIHLAEGDVRPLLLSLLPVYVELLEALIAEGVAWVQFDDPALVLDLPPFAAGLYRHAYGYLHEKLGGRVKLQLTTYFDDVADNLPLVLSLPISGLHLDFVRAPQQLTPLMQHLTSDSASSSLELLSLGVVDGRNIWKTDLNRMLSIVRPTLKRLLATHIKEVLLSSSCSLLHSPHSLAAETKMNPAYTPWLAFAVEKIRELVLLSTALQASGAHAVQALLQRNSEEVGSRRHSPLIVNQEVRDRVDDVSPDDLRRHSPFAQRAAEQQRRLGLATFPTTTIGSFPQTAEVRSWRARLKAGKLSADEYDANIRAETRRCVALQEEWGLDVLVDGEFDRSDMVEFFGTQLSGYLFTQQGWVQSYGSRCVKPPIIFGDIHRPLPMTVTYTAYAQSCTQRPVKGMLTGPITCLKWSFVRDDQPLSITAQQLALAIRDEVADLERADISIIQIDEPAIREGLPLHAREWAEYLQWSVDAFLLASCGVQDTTQIHTHMCYSHFEDILPAIIRLDADVLTIENARSDASLLRAFQRANYPNALGPGLYDIHSPRVPTVAEMSERCALLRQCVGERRLWINPDCGLKTRGWKEVEAALRNMVEVAKAARRSIEA